MRSSRCGEARPVRTVASSLRLPSTAWSMRPLASSSNSSISSTDAPLQSFRGLARDERADLLAADDPIYVALVPDVEDVDRQVVVHAERERRRVHHLEPPLDRLAVADRGDELGLGIGRRIGVVDAFD